MSKTNILIVSSIGSLLFLLFLFAKDLGFCAFVSSSCADMFDPIAENLLVFVVLLLFSLITYKMRDEVYRAWLRFSYFWIPLSMVLILLSPEYSGGYIPLYSITKSSVAFVSSLLFVIISLTIIAWKYFSTRRSGQV